MATTTTTLDFSALTARHHRPSRVAQIIPRPIPIKNDNTKSSKSSPPITESPSSSSSSSEEPIEEMFIRQNSDGTLSLIPRNPDNGGNDPSPEGEPVIVRLQDEEFLSQKKLPLGDIEDDDGSELRRRRRDMELKYLSDLEQTKKREADELARRLFQTTRLYARHAADPSMDESSTEGDAEEDIALVSVPDEDLSPKLHEIELADWEDRIDWDGAVNPHSDSITPLDPMKLLSTPTNPSLESLDLSSISWLGADAPPGHNESLSSRQPLILQRSIAGSSVARLAAPQKRPNPFSSSDAFVGRYDREMNAGGNDDGGVVFSGIGNSLNPDNEKMEQIIAARQAKRAQMAIDKSHRVTEAMGTLALGGGKGRTITSSLMGPGGTERTGRPSRHAGSSSAHDAEYVEQLELVYNHTLVKPDLRKSELRQFHRPRLPRSMVRADRYWQFQYRALVTDNKKKGATNADGSMVGSYALHQDNQSKIRNEADLSPSEGELVLFEYCEERPSVQLSKGMACKIVNYYRGPKSRCPISKGGGDRPIRKRGADSNKQTKDENSKEDKLPELNTSNGSFDIKEMLGDWKKKKDPKKSEQKHSDVDILPEGVTEILHPKVHGPFIGEVEDNTTQSGLIANLFAAPIFLHDPEPSDFLMILGKKPSHRSILKPENDPQCFYVSLRPLPTSTFTVGQTEPRVKVFAPNTTGEKNFTAPFVTYQIAKALARTEAKEGRGLRFDEINDRLFANTVLLPNALRQRIKQVASYDKNTQIWTTKPLGFEDFPGVEALGRRFSPEGVAAYESACAAVRRMCDIGIHDLFSGSSSVQSVGAAMAYIIGSATASRERKSKIAKMAEYAKTTSKSNTKQRQLALYEKAAAKLDNKWKEIRRKQEVARFIYEELQLAPWHLTTEFIEVHKNAQGTAMMKLTGLGDPSGRGEAYNFLREVDAKPNKGTGNSDGALHAQIKKITGTENDLRKLTMKQMASLLRSYGMGQKEIDTLKRWDRVHVIRDLSTKAASDGMGDGLERYARGEKMKLSDQKQMYRDRIQEIWRRQREALKTDAGVFDASARAKAQAGSSSAAATAAEKPEAEKPVPKQPPELDESDSDSDDDDDLAAALEEDMLDVRQTNQILADNMRGPSGGSSATGLPRSEDTQEMSKDARELAALKRKIEEERAAQEGLSKATTSKGKSAPLKEKVALPTPAANRKVLRRRITKSYPDGTQTTTFKFIVRPDEIDKILKQNKKKSEQAAAKLAKENNHHHHSDYHFMSSSSPNKKKHPKKHKPPNDKFSDTRTVGHAMFEDEDDVLPHTNRSTPKPNIKLQLQRSTRVVTTKTTTPKHHRTKPLPSTPPKVKVKPKLHLGKLKQKASQEKRIKKRRREAEEADLYSTAPQRKGTSNRRERGAARDRMPHVIMADRMEQIRSEVQKRPGSGPFHRPVNRRALPRYYELISEPIDLQTIRDKNQKYEYRTVDSFLRDFELMKSNAVKFNGHGSILADEATAICEFVTDKIESSRQEFTAMEEAVRDQLGGATNRQKKQKTMQESKSPQQKKHNSSSEKNTANVVLDGVETTVNLGDISTNFVFGGNGDDTDSDDSVVQTVEL